MSSWLWLFTGLLLCSTVRGSKIVLLHYSQGDSLTRHDGLWSWPGVKVQVTDNFRIAIKPNDAVCSILFRVPNSDGRTIFKYLGTKDGHSFRLLPKQLLLVCSAPTISEFELNRAIECYAYGNTETANAILQNEHCALFGSHAV